MSAKEYLESKTKFEDKYPNIPEFMINKEIIKEKKRYKYKRQLPSPKFNKSIYIPFSELEKTNKKISEGTESILNSMKTIAGIVTVVGVAFIGINKYLNEKSNFDIGNIYGGTEKENTGLAVSDKVSINNAHMSEKAKQKLKNNESLRLEAYDLEGKGIYTIGYGHYGSIDGKPIKKGQKITKEKAEELFEKDVRAKEDQVKWQLKKAGITTPISQNQFDAMVDYSFMSKLGPKFLAKLKRGDYKGAAKELDFDTGMKNKNRMNYLQDLFANDVGMDNKLKSSIQPVNESFNQRASLNEVGGVKGTKNGVTYDENKSMMTSGTLLTTGTNKYYDNSKGPMGTYMGKTITSGIGARNVKGGSKWHRGLDLAYNYGTPVYSFVAGKITHSGVLGGFGRLVIVTDSNKYQHLYGHLSKIVVTNGQLVKKGDLLGYSGGSSVINGVLKNNAFQPHLHYGIWKPGGRGDKLAYIDPRTYTYPGDEPISSYSSKNTNKIDNNNAKLKEAKQTKQNDIKTKNNKDNSSNININSKVKNSTTPNMKDIGMIDYKDIRANRNGNNKKE